MTEQEFSNEFDVEYNNITSNMAPGLDEYEKSKFLTTAQEEIVAALYSGSSGDGFEHTELNRRYLANLISTISPTIPATPTTIGLFKDYSVTFPTSIKILVIISERATIKDSCYPEGKIVNVVPVTYDELNKVLNNPFRRPNNRKVLRKDTASQQVSIITKADLLGYTCEYLKKPSPIVLTTLPANLSIDGVTTAQTSALDASLHRTILKHAVQLAAASWASNNKK